MAMADGNRKLNSLNPNKEKEPATHHTTKGGFALQ